MSKPILCLKKIPFIKNKAIAKVTEKANKELLMILNLQKIRPAIKPIRLSLEKKELRDAKRASKLEAKPRKSGLIVSIPLPLEEDKVERYVSTPA